MARVFNLAIGRRSRSYAGRRKIPAVTSAMRTLAANRRGARAAVGRSDTVRSDLTLESGSSRSKRVARNVLIDVYSLCVLAKIVKA